MTSVFRRTKGRQALPAGVVLLQRFRRDLPSSGGLQGDRYLHHHVVNGREIHAAEHVGIASGIARGTGTVLRDTNGRRFRVDGGTVPAASNGNAYSFTCWREDGTGRNSSGSRPTRRTSPSAETCLKTRKIRHRAGTRCGERRHGKTDQARSEW